MRRTNERVERTVAGQHGVATREQLLAAGVSPHALDRYVRSGDLVLLHRGVYRLAAYPPSAWTRAMASVLAASAGGRIASTVSHAAAATLWEYREWEETDSLHLICPRRLRLAGVCSYRFTLAGDEVTRLRGVPVTTPARTVLDLAGSATMRELEHALAAAERGDARVRAGIAGACGAAEVRGEVRALLERHPCHPGSGRLRRLLAALDASGRPPLFLRSRAEERALAIIRRGRIPEPRANVRIAAFEVDFVWPDQRLILEVDGYAFHSSDSAFNRDRERDRALAAAGYQVLRFSWGQLSREPFACLAALCIALGQRMA
jgi:very-short-patch-repair endonuclease